LRVPNLLVPIDLRDGVPTAPSLFALGEGRRAARAAGLTVFAVVLADPRPEDEVQKLAARLGLAGADKVLLCEGAGLDAPALDFTHGPALQTAAERVPPLLVLFPAGGAGLQLAAPLAARLGAAFATAADLEVSDSPTPLPDGVGRLCLRRWRRDGGAYRRLDPVELERPVIALLGAGAPGEVGTPDVEVQTIACAPPAVAVELESRPDEHAALSLAPGLVLVGAGEALASQLAAAAPPGVAVADVARVAPAALAACTPRVVLAVEASAAAVSTSPRSRVGVAASAPAEAPGADVVWRAEGAPAWSDLAAALPALTPAGGTS
jgi:electron transfer flavoprotein alpha subunit